MLKKSQWLPCLDGIVGELPDNDPDLYCIDNIPSDPDVSVWVLWTNDSSTDVSSILSCLNVNDIL